MMLDEPLPGDRSVTPMPLPNPDGSFDEEGDWIVRQFIAPGELRLIPEEYVARHAHALGAFSFSRYRFRDSTLATWVDQVGQLLASEEQIKLCRERFLSPEELTFTRLQDSEDL